ncbi:MAG: hypothetical protein JW709_11910 [Sedimentisphaerales bacterium]|nr:hypothetical protein [Sedimentisphaerales bacterium]
MIADRFLAIARTTAAILTAILAISPTAQAQAEMANEPCLRMSGFDVKRAAISYLSWDTEGSRRVEQNLLRPKSEVALRVRLGGQWRSAVDLPTTGQALGDNEYRYDISVGPQTKLRWHIVASKNSLEMSVSAHGENLALIEAVELVFPFDPRVTPTTVIPSVRNADGTMRLPAVINAPDFGQMLLSDDRNDHLMARLLGSRKNKTVDFVIVFPKLEAEKSQRLKLIPIHLPVPHGLHDKAIWKAARRGWFGAFQPNAKWGTPGTGQLYGAPAGVLANNVISDPASCSLWFYADKALWTPEIAPGISIMNLVRDTIDWWLTERMLPSGEMICYWNMTDFLDANAGPIIAAWDYVEVSGDTKWLAGRIDKLEKLAEFLAKRDVDGDGLVEAKQSGNRNALVQPTRSSCWWDAVNYGHKCGHSNAIIYRAWRCLADLEAKLGRDSRQAHYTKLSDKLKAVYAKTLYNPHTGWLAGWKSQDGELHDYGLTAVNGLAIEYGLVEPQQGREILSRLRQKMQDEGFKRYDLGVPSSLLPVRRSDYLLPDAIGCPKREDGSDTFGQYMNSGITAGQVLHFLAAHYVVGDGDKADVILRSMLERQQQGKFQNGVTDDFPRGIDWTDWNGNPTGYEGYLADSFRFLQAVLLREPAFRQRLYRPLERPGLKEL